MKIEFLEQPTQFHRFRYEAEVSGGKLGGVLYSRSSSGKNFVRLRVSGFEPLIHKAVIIVGATVNPENYPHPYFLVGENCSNGAFQLKKELDSLAGKTEFDFALEKVSIVCVSTKGDKLKEAIENRRKINFNPYGKKITEITYNSRTLKSVRLAFQVFYQDFNDQAIASSAIVSSEVITDIRQQAKLGIFDIHPNQVCLSGCQEIWVYFDDPLPHTDPMAYKAEVDMKIHGTFSCTVKAVKKHLLILSKPDATGCLADRNERNRGHLIITDTRNDVSDSRDIILVDMSNEYDPFIADAPQKRKYPNQMQQH